MSTPPLIPTLENYLKLTIVREQAISANMANIDTPGYRTRDIDFRSELLRAIDSGTGEMAPVSHAVRGLIQRPDGNDVNLDRESLLLAETQMQYQLGVQVVRSEFHRLLSAINEGK